MITPYYADDMIRLYHGRCEDVLPQLGLQADLIMADPPYAETSLEWDRWPDGWPALLAGYGSSMWCFGSMRMFLDRAGEFSAWKLSQDVVWQKHAGSSMAADRFKRVHEHALHWYRGPWAEIHHEPVRRPRNGPHVAHNIRSKAGQHLGKTGPRSWEDDGTRMQESVIPVRSMHRNGAINPTEKPEGILTPLITYGCPPGGLVLSPFAGSGSDLITARNLGRPSVGIEVREEQCEATALRLSQGVLDFG